MASLADATPPIALGALDGRYRGAVAPLVDHLSEPALNRERVRVEVEWLIFLTTHQVVPGVRALTDDEQQRLRQVVDDFGAAEIEELATIERETLHDVKAVEYFLKRRLTAIAPSPEDAGLAELIHFCCTSEDINNLSYALMVQGEPRRSIRSKVPEVLGLVGLSSKMSQMPDELSGGEQQRVSIARAFVNHPPLLICDEPTGNLDPDTSVGIMQLLYRINRTGTTVVMATHDREMVDKMRRRVIALEDGVVVRDERRGGYG